MDRKSKKRKIVINDYMQHWIHSTETGHVFKIVDGKDNVLEIECNWKTYRRKGRFYKIP